MRHNILVLSAFIACLWATGMPTSSWAKSTETKTADPIEQAYQVLGTPYRYGGKSPATGFDCSGLVTHVFGQSLGLELPHNASAQSKLGTRVRLAELAPGDLVFYNTRRRPYSHVGIYVGDDKFIHAPKPGSSVRVESMKTAYWVKRYNGSRRLQSPGGQP
jgi:cell wall-associated NlpC family hydrolase